MNAVVVDTDVVSLVFKRDTRVETYLSALSAPDLLVSFMTEGELERWIFQDFRDISAKFAFGGRRHRLNSWRS
jgi:hypothetical protein